MVTPSTTVYSLLIVFIVVAWVSIECVDAQSDARRGSSKTLCKLDRAKYCPDLPDSSSIELLFTSTCFKDALKSVSPQCKKSYFQWKHEFYAEDVSTSCLRDRKEFCPNLLPPYTATALFTSDCFKLHKEEISLVCQNEMEAFLRSYSSSSRFIPSAFIALHPEITAVFILLLVLISYCVWKCCSSCKTTPRIRSAEFSHVVMPIVNIPFVEPPHKPETSASTTDLASATSSFSNSPIEVVVVSSETEQVM